MFQTEQINEASTQVLRQAKVLIVDDLPANVRLLESILRKAGHGEVCSTTDPRETLDLFESFQPDILLLDLNMPYWDGFEVMRRLKPRMTYRKTPIIMLTADSEAKTKHRALRLGVRDFVTKPFDELEVLLRIDNVLETHFHRLLLEAMVHERTKELLNAQLETLNRLALASEYRDDQTGLHARRVGRTSGLIAQAMNLPLDQVEFITQAASLHDIGKVGIPDSILLKPGKLTTEEFDAMKNHTQIGAKILTGSSSAMLQIAEEIALTHHEHWDGNGYAGMKGDAIPLSGRIVAIADFFDALTHARPYKEAWPVEEAVQAVVERKGSHFDPQVVSAFLTLPHHDLID